MNDVAVCGSVYLFIMKQYVNYYYGRIVYVILLFVGTIPSSIGSLTGLNTFDLLYNSLTGTSTSLL